MYLSRIHVRASLPVNYGLLYWAIISGLHVINKWKMCSVRKSMRYVRYGALRIEPCNDFQNIVLVALTTHLFNQQMKYTTDCTLKTAAVATRVGGETEVVSRPE